MRNGKSKLSLLMVLACLLVSILLHSCKKEDPLANAPLELAQNNEEGATWFARSNDEDEEWVILGNQRNNPFSVANINQAVDDLYGSSGQPKVATHRYIKFKPTSQEHLAILEDWETYSLIPVFAFPLDYEIVKEGITYIDPAVSDSLYTYQYASVPVDSTLPQVPFEELEELYLNESDPLLLAQSFLLTGNEEEITEYAFKGGLPVSEVQGYDNSVLDAIGVTPIPEAADCPGGYGWVLVSTGAIIQGSNGVYDNQYTYEWRCLESDPTPPPPPGLNDCGCVVQPSDYPAGCVSVENNSSNTFEPVERAMVKVRNGWFRSDAVFTEWNGCWYANRQYSGKVRVRVVFKNQHVKVTSPTAAAIRAVRDFVDRFDAPPYNPIAVEYSENQNDNNSTGRRYWAAAHSINTVNEYRNRVTAEGVPLPPSDLNWYIIPGNGRAAAPMLQGVVFGSSHVAQVWTLFLVAFGPIPTGVATVLYGLAVPHLPDIWMPYAAGDDVADFKAVGFHELAHASHYALVGESYWVPYRDHIIANLGYGTFGNFNQFSSVNDVDDAANIVALGEAVGFYMESKYGGTVAGNDDATFVNNFIPAGLIWDLEDPTQDVNPISDPNDPNLPTAVDNISGFTRSMIFDALNPNIRSIRAFRDELRTLHLSSTPNNATDFNNFVDVYDVFN